MKTLAICLLLTSLALQGHAKDSEALSEIHKKRQDLLAAIVKQLERQRDEGICDLVDVIKAKVRLNKFERNRASDWGQKRQFQTRIVELERSRLTILQSLHREGAAGTTVLEVMRAQERHLAARQRGLEIDAHIHQSAEKDGDTKRD